MSIGKITVDLLLRSGSFRTDLDRDAKLAEKRAKEIDAAIKKAGAAIGASLVAIGAGFGVWIKNTINSMDELSKASQKVGLPTEDLSKLNYAAGLADVSLDTLANSMGKLTKSQVAALNSTSEQAKIFDALGISVKGADGNLRRSADILTEFADKFSALGGSPEAMAAGFAVFGKSFQDLIPLLAGGSQGIREAGEELEAFGGVISTEAGRNAEEFNDNLTRLQTAAAALGAQVANNLLPDLIKLTDNLVQLTKDGNAAAEIADFIKAGFQVLSGAAVIVSSTVRGVTADLLALGNAGAVAWNVLTGDWKGASSAANRASEARKMAAEESADIARVFSGQAPARKVAVNFAGRDPEPTGLFRKSAGQVQAEADAARLQKQLRDALAKTGGGGAKKSGKSDAEREAEQIAKATREMTAAQRAWQTELDGTGNAIMDSYAKRLDEITTKSEKYKDQGIPTEQVAKFGEEMRKLADQLKGKELEEFQEEFASETREMAAAIDGSASPALLRYENDLREVDKVMKNGVVLTTQLYEERLKALDLQRNSTAIQLRKDFGFEIQLLGRTREEQEQLTLARQLGADAATEQGRAAIAALLDVQAARKATDDQITIMDGLRSSTRGLFEDLKNGVGVWDSLTNAANRFADVLFDVAAKNIAESLFGQTGSGPGGAAGGWLSNIFGAFSGGGGSGAGASSTGGGWLKALGSLFGGARAEGGGVWPNSSFLVGERGPELFIPRSAGTILPAHLTRGVMGGGGRGDFTQNVTQVIQGHLTRRTALQAAKDQGREARRAMARNG